MKPPLGTALAQQELPQKERPDFMAGYDAGMADARRMAQQGAPATSDEWLANCPQEVRDFANKLKAAPQPAQECKPLCELCVKRGYNFCANVAQTTPITVQSAQPVAQQDHIPDAGEMVLSDDEILTIAHRKATRYTHAVAPGQVTYGFAVAHLLDFVRAVLEEKTAQPVAHYDKTEMNAFVQDLYNKKMQEGKHGHYETMFHVVHKAIERADGIREVK